MSNSSNKSKDSRVYFIYYIIEIHVILYTCYILYIVRDIYIYGMICINNYKLFKCELGGQVRLGS